MLASIKQEDEDISDRVVNFNETSGFTDKMNPLPSKSNLQSIQANDLSQCDETYLTAQPLADSQNPAPYDHYRSTDAHPL